MKYFVIILFAALFTAPVKSRADASPFKEAERIDIRYKTLAPLQLDSCGIIYNLDKVHPDTAFGCKGGICVTVENPYRIRLIRSVPYLFKVVFYFKNRVMVTPVLNNNNGLTSYHSLVVTDNEIKDITPVFGTSYSNYLFALLITIVLESLVVLVFLLVRKMPLKNLKYVTYVNLVTHPILWLVSARLTGFALGDLIGEPLVLLIEAVILYRCFRPFIYYRTAFWLSFLMNLTSFFIGGFFYLLLAQ
ncbi:MAG TPA: hypothetical protein VG738_00570 [Chitinophagaceae bacterium]|nr:hypothetical protein [Chitinophagaceae bacterium]